MMFASYLLNSRTSGLHKRNHNPHHHVHDDTHGNKGTQGVSSDADRHPEGMGGVPGDLLDTAQHHQAPYQGQPLSF
jgi:hypothetical protein